MTTALEGSEGKVGPVATTTVTAEQLKTMYEAPAVLARSPELPPAVREPRQRMWAKYLAVGIGGALIGLAAGYGLGLPVTTQPAGTSITVPTTSVGVPINPRLPAQFR